MRRSAAAYVQLLSSSSPALVYTPQPHWGLPSALPSRSIYSFRTASLVKSARRPVITERAHARACCDMSLFRSVSARPEAALCCVSFRFCHSVYPSGWKPLPTPLVKRTRCLQRRAFACSGVWRLYAPHWFSSSSTIRARRVSLCPFSRLPGVQAIALLPSSRARGVSSAARFRRALILFRFRLCSS